MRILGVYLNVFDDMKSNQATLMINVRGVMGVPACYYKTVITNKLVDYWIHGNTSLKTLCTDYNGWKQPLLNVRVLSNLPQLCFC